MALTISGPPPEHLREKYNVFAIKFKDNYVLKVHIGRPISFKTFCDNYVLRHSELDDKHGGVVHLVRNIEGLEKVVDGMPDFELSAIGELWPIKNSVTT